MKRALQITIILLLSALVLIQVLSLTGKTSQGEKQDVCPTNAISMKAGKAVIDSMKCIGCRRCVDGFVAIPREENYLSEDLLRTDAIITKELEHLPVPIQIKAAKALASPAVKSLDQKPQVQQKQPQETSPKDLDSTQTAENPEQSDYYVVDAQSCISCGRCLRVCPEHAISYRDGKAYIDPEKCTNCGICAGLEPKKFRGCPVDAIHPAL